MSATHASTMSASTSTTMGISTQRPQARGDKLALVDMTGAPRRDGLGELMFWTHALLRYYVSGPTDQKESPTWLAPLLRAYERQLLEASREAGDFAPRQVPRVKAADLTPEAFQATYLRANSPVVIEGMAKDWAASQRWSLAAFRQALGRERLVVRVRGDAIDQRAFAAREVSLAELIDDIERGGTLYGSNMEDIFNHHQWMRDDLPIDLLSRYLAHREGRRVASTQLFLGGRALSGMHCASSVNLFCMIRGTKRWTFVPPAYTAWMYPISRKDLLYSASLVPWLGDADAVEEAGYPLYRYAPKFVADLEEGDVLFSPQWWWHAVETPGPAIGVATRALNDLFLGNIPYAVMWGLSPAFWRLVRHDLKSRWSADDVAGARRAFEVEG